MAGEFVVTEDAYRDIERAEDYIASHSGEDAVIAFEDELFCKFDEVAETPLRWPVYQFGDGIELVHEYRSANVRRYKIFYYVRGGDVQSGGDAQAGVVVVARVLHVASDFTRRNW